MDKITVLETAHREAQQYEPRRRETSEMRVVITRAVYSAAISIQRVTGENFNRNSADFLTWRDRGQSLRCQVVGYWEEKWWRRRNYAEKDIQVCIRAPAFAAHGRGEIPLVCVKSVRRFTSSAIPETCIGEKSSNQSAIKATIRGIPRRNRPSNQTELSVQCRVF